MYVCTYLVIHIIRITISKYLYVYTFSVGFDVIPYFILHIYRNIYIGLVQTKILIRITPHIKHGCREILII